VCTKRSTSSISTKFREADINIRTGNFQLIREREDVDKDGFQDYKKVLDFLTVACIIKLLRLS